MKLLTLQHEGGFHPAVLVGADALDLVLARDIIPAAASVPASMRDLLAGGRAMLAAVKDIAAQAQQQTIADRLRAAGALVPFDTAPLGPVVPDPKLLLSGSMNSWGHLHEMHDEAPEHPCAFHKSPSAITGSGADIMLPPGHGDHVDWEGEFCLVVGERCHNVSVEEAQDKIVGYTLLNDVSAREYAMEFIQSRGQDPARIAQAWERNVLGKNYPGFAPIGPVIATVDELPSPLTYHMETVVNGEVMQSSTQEDPVFGPAEMLSYFSQFLVFEPGDIISMGSPPGVGMARTPQLFLKAGDIVEVKTDAIGVLRNRIVATA